MWSSLLPEGSVMTFNGEIRDPLAAWLQDSASSGRSVPCRSNKFTIADEEMITDSPIIVLIESGANLPCSATLFPFHQPFVEGVGCSHQQPVENVKALQNSGALSVFGKALFELRVQLDHFPE